MNVDKIYNQLWELQKICNEYKSTDCLADWVLFAIERQIMTNRATGEFEHQFVQLNQNELLDMVKYCLNYSDKSNDGIIKSVKRYIGNNLK